MKAFFENAQNFSSETPSPEKLPTEEMQRRHALCCELCHADRPQLGGILIFSPLAIYYLTGTLTDGIFWLPFNDKPLLFVRRAEERARMESPLASIYTLPMGFQWSQLVDLCQEYGAPLTHTMAVEMGSLSWADSREFRNAFIRYDIMPADGHILQARARKSPWELRKMRRAGELHADALCRILPPLLHVGMSERDIARVAWEVFFSLGHCGMNRMGNFGEECFLGHVAVGDNGNYPSHFNGPLGLRGEHPATPYMGNADSIWQNNHILSTDMGFVFEGYHTDKTQMYFSGKIRDMPDVARKAHDACIDIQQRAAERLCAGAIPSNIWEEAKARAEKWGVAEGFMGFGNNKVRFLGHGIGLVIDETPVIATRFDAPLVEGMTLAIEPKVGIPGVGMVGVENTFEVTRTGGVSLTGTDFSIIEVL